MKFDFKNTSQDELRVKCDKIAKVKLLSSL